MPHLKLKKIPIDRDNKDMEIALPSPFPPSFSVDNKQISEIKNWEVGEKYRLVIDVVQTSKNENERGVSGTFDIVAYKYLKEKSIDEMTDKEFGEYQGEALSKT